MTAQASQRAITVETAVETAAEIARLMRQREPGRQAVSDMFELLARHVIFDAATLYLLNADGDELDEAATYGHTVNVVDFVQFGVGSGLAGWAAERRRPLYIPGRSPETSGARDYHDSIMILPLIREDDLLGVLCFSHPAPDAFTEANRAILELAAELVAFSLERIVHRQIQQRLQRRQQARAITEAHCEHIPEVLTAIGDVADAVCEEMNRPLSVIVGNAQLIELDTDVLPPAVSQRIHAIVAGAKQISLITHQLHKIRRLVPEGAAGDAASITTTHDQSAGDSA